MMSDGVYTDVSHNRYHDIDRVSSSYLRRFSQCPASANIPVKETPAMILGRATHVLILEGKDKFHEQFVVAAPMDRRTKAGREAWAETQAIAADKEIISTEDFERVHGMWLSTLNHPFAGRVLKEGLSEQTVLWTDGVSGLRCKCRPDRIPAGHLGAIVDLKTTANASEHAFLRSIVSYGYAIQAAFYCDGTTAVTGKIFDAFVFVAVETTPPYRCEVYTIDNEFLLWGRQEYEKILRQIKVCQNNGVFPAYQNAGCVELYKPAYLQTY